MQFSQTAKATSPQSAPATAESDNRVPDRSPGKTSPRRKAPPPAIAKAATQVRALFHLPPRGKLSFPLPPAARLRIWKLSAASLAVPAGVALLSTGLIAGAGALLLSLYGWISTLSPLLAILLMFLPGLALLVFAIALTSPFWPGRAREGHRVKVTGREAPRLVMFVTAVCKVIEAPLPSAIYLVPDPQIRAAFKGVAGKPQNGQTELYLGAPLLACLSIQQLSALIARECGRWSRPEFRGRYSLISGLLNWLETHSRGKAASRFSPGPVPGDDELRGLLHWTARRTASIHNLGLSLAGYCQGRLIAMLRRDPIVRGYETRFLGKADSTLHQQEKRVEQAYREAIQSMLHEKGRQLYVNSLSQLTGELLGTEEREKPSASGIVRSGQLASCLLENFSARDEQLTRLVYRSGGLNPDMHLFSLQEIQRRESNSQKLHAIGRHYFGQWFQESQYWQMPARAVAPGKDPRLIVKQLNQCIKRIRYLSPDRPGILVKYEKTRQQVVELKAAKKIIAAGMKFQFRHCSELSDDLGRELFSREGQLKESREELRQQNVIMGERIVLGLALDNQHRPLTMRLHLALLCFSRLSQKAESLAMDLEEFTTLQDYKPSSLPQSYQAHVKQLLSEIAGAYRSLRRSLQKCPYDFYDRRYPTLLSFLDSKLTQTTGELEPMLPEKADILLDVLAQAYRYTSELAASYGARMEKAYKVETIRRVRVLSELNEKTLNVRTVLP